MTPSKIKISPKMNKGIKFIQEALDIKFKGSTFDEAKEFISKYMPEASKIDIRTKRKPSDKMLRGIEFIENILDVHFEGETMLDATKFISEYMEKAKYISERRKGK